MFAGIQLIIKQPHYAFLVYLSYQKDYIQTIES